MSYSLMCLFFLYSVSSTVHTAPRLLFSSTRTKHLCRERLWRMAFYRRGREGEDKELASGSIECQKFLMRIIVFCIALESHTHTHMR